MNFDATNLYSTVINFFRSNALALLISLSLLFLIERLSVFLIDTYISKDEKRHLSRKWVRYGLLTIALIWILLLYGSYARKDTFFLIGLVLAGIAISLRDVFSNFVGWIVINSPKGFHHGDRIQIGTVSGDVIDIGVLRTILVEIGGWVASDQSTGRLISLPNSLILSTSVYNYTEGHDLIWNEMKILVTFESNWESAEKIMLRIAHDDYEEHKDMISEMLKNVKKRYVLKFNIVTPKVYVTIADSGVLLTLRYLVRARRRRNTDDIVAREILKAFAHEKDIHFAYPTVRYYKND